MSGLFCFRGTGLFCWNINGLNWKYSMFLHNKESFFLLQALHFWEIERHEKIMPCKSISDTGCGAGAFPSRFASACPRRPKFGYANSDRTASDGRKFLSGITRRLQSRMGHGDGSCNRNRRGSADRLSIKPLELCDRSAWNLWLPRRGSE